MSEAEDKLSEMGLALSSPPPPLANYVPAVRTGNLVFLAGVGPRTPDGHNITGKGGPRPERGPGQGSGPPVRPQPLGQPQRGHW